MNTVFGSIASVSTKLGSPVGNSLTQLSPLQKRVAALACVAFGVLTIVYIAYRCFIDGKGSSPSSPVLNSKKPTSKKPSHSIIPKQPSPFIPPKQPSPVISPKQPSPVISPKQSSPVISPKQSPEWKDEWFYSPSPSKPQNPIQPQSNPSSPQVIVNPQPNPIDLLGQVDAKKQKPLSKQDFRSRYDSANQLMNTHHTILNLLDDLEKNQEHAEKLLTGGLDDVKVDTKKAPAKIDDQQKDDQDVKKKDDLQGHDILDIEEEEDDQDDIQDLGNVTQFGDLTDKIDKLNTEIKKELVQYLNHFHNYLQEYFQDKSRIDQFSGKMTSQGVIDASELHMHLANFSGFIDRFADHEDFIYAALDQVNKDLGAYFFTLPSDLSLPENKKMDLIAVQELFAVVNKCLPVIKTKNPKLANDLKIKFANLPITQYMDRAKFSNLYLTETEQLNLIVNHLQNREDSCIDAAIQQLQIGNLADEEVIRLAKLAAKNKSHLSPSNLAKLQNALNIYMGKYAPKTWDNEADVLKSFKAFFNTSSVYFDEGYDQADLYTPPTNITRLYRLAKAKKYFTDQVGLDESLIRIPRWYHATKQQYLTSILGSEVRVEHKQAYRGAWVSSKREPSMGTHTLAFTHHIVKIDPDVFIGFEKGSFRWRGLQKPIPMRDTKNIPHVVLVALPSHSYATEKKGVKQELVNKNFKKVKVITSAQLDFMQREILHAIGNPNLNEKWWGKADVKDLERI